MSVHAHTQAHAVSPHTVHPATLSLQLEEPGRPHGPFPAVKDLSSPPRAERWPGRAPTRSPAWVTAGTLPASFLPREARAAQRLMQPRRSRGWQGCAGARAGRAALAAAVGAGASTLRSRGPTRHRASIHCIHTASLPLFALALPYLHEQPPVAALPFSGPRRALGTVGVSADIPRAVGTGEDPQVPAVAPRERVSAQAGGEATTLAGCPHAPWGCRQPPPTAPHLLLKRPQGRGDG